MIANKKCCKREKKNMEDKEYLRDLKISKRVFALYFSNHQNFREDLIQESLIALWRSRNRYDEKRGSYSNFAVNVAFNAMVTFLRKESKYMNNEDLTCEFLDEPFDIDSYLDLRIWIEKRLRLLTKKQAFIVKILGYVAAGYSSLEIAKKMNLSRSYVNKILHDFRKTYNLDSIYDMNAYLDV